MKKKTDAFYALLFRLLMLFLFLSVVQRQTGLFKTTALNGVVNTTEAPVLDYEGFCTGRYQMQLEKHMSENYGFRGITIKLYNQYLWDFYRKTYAPEVVAGKHNWLFYPQSVNDYYGTEMYRWQDSAEEAKATYEREVKNMVKLRTILEPYGIDFMMFMAPEKGFVYSEYLPARTKDTTSINARVFFDEKLAEVGFPYIEMTKWFLQMKDTCNYLLLPQTGAHWDFASVYAADSLFRYMESLKGIELPRLSYSRQTEDVSELQKTNRDLEWSLNLLRKIHWKQEVMPAAKVDIVADTAMVKPRVLFIGNSFLWRINDYIPLDNVFDSPEFWYYYSTAYSAPGFSVSKDVMGLDLLEKLFEFDYIVWFTTGNQMYKACYGFVENALIALCVEDSVRERVCNHLMDSLKNDAVMSEKYVDLLQGDTVQYYWKLRGEVRNLLIKDPEKYFPEIRDESFMSTRNSRVEKQLVIRRISRSEEWMSNLRCQMVIHNTTLARMLSEEADNVLLGRPLYRDEKNIHRKKSYFEDQVKRVMEEIKGKPELLRQIEEKAVTKGITVEESLERDARWIVSDKINRGLIVLPEE